MCTYACEIKWESNISRTKMMFLKKVSLTYPSPRKFLYGKLWNAGDIFIPLEPAKLIQHKMVENNGLLLSQLYANMVHWFLLFFYCFDIFFNANLFFKYVFFWSFLNDLYIMFFTTYLKIYKYSKIAYK